MVSKNLFAVAIALSLLALAACLPKATTTDKTSISEEDPKQLWFFGQGKETSTPNFVRLVVMRIIYGIASTMGMEDRLAEIFAPPGEDGGDFGLDFGGIDEIFDDR